MNYIWFDLDNSPHVPIFRPVFNSLQKNGVYYYITAREFAQTIPLLNYWGINHEKVGQHGGKNKLHKIINLLIRSMQLCNKIKSRSISLAVSHGSRTQVLAAWIMDIKSVVMIDYEYTETHIFNAFATKILIPSLIPDKRLRDAGINMKKVIRYNGFKEELYLSEFVPIKGFRETIGISDESILITLRPPSTVGNYHDERSEKYFIKCLEYILSHKNTICLILNRISTDKQLLPLSFTKYSNIKYLDTVVDGLQLIWNSDIVISGGGTMNRESALLGVPTFSIFSGKKPYLDEYLESKKKLTFINKIEDIKNISIEKREIPNEHKFNNKTILGEIVSLITEI